MNIIERIKYAADQCLKQLDGYSGFAGVVMLAKLNKADSDEMKKFAKHERTYTEELVIKVDRIEFSDGIKVGTLEYSVIESFIQVRHANALILVKPLVKIEPIKEYVIVHIESQRDGNSYNIMEKKEAERMCNSHNNLASSKILSDCTNEIKYIIKANTNIPIPDPHPKLEKVKRLAEEIFNLCNK
jgi:hypothetical protein